MHLGLTWSQSEDFFLLHAMPTVHCSNYCDTSHNAGIYHTDVGGGGGYDMHTGAGASGIDDIGGEDFDYAMDCGDFIF